MSFIENLAKTVDETYNRSITENGAVGYHTTNHALLDMNFKVSSYRNRTNREIAQDFLTAFAEDRVLAMKWLFYARDAREGLGERRLFRVCLNTLARQYPELTSKVVALVAEYGRYDDLFVLLDTSLKEQVISLITTTLISDMKKCNAGEKNVTLLAKWMPSENASSAESKKLARMFATKLGVSCKEYRKMLSKLRAYIGIVETAMSQNNWGEIDYERVPSRANLVYNSAFLKHDEVRRREFLGAVQKGEAKINASVLFPHDIVHKYSGTRGWFGYSIKPLDAGIEALWKAQPDLVGGNDSTIVVADGSGSMTSCVGGTSVTALEVANSLAIYFAERCQGEFKNKYITFSSRPQLVNLTGANLHDNLQIALTHNEVANTNIKATFDLILRTAVQNKMAQEDLPKNVLVISDMEFDGATCGSRVDSTLFAVIARDFAAYGYTLPRLIFWNVCGRTNTIPVKENKAGVALVSGFSTNIIKMVMGNATDPYQLLVDTLNVERYQPIEDAISDWVANN